MTSLIRRNGIYLFCFCPRNSPFQTAALTEARMKVQHTAPVDLYGARIRQRDCLVHYALWFTKDACRKYDKEDVQRRVTS